MKTKYTKHSLKESILEYAHEQALWLQEVRNSDMSEESKRLFYQRFAEQSIDDLISLAYCIERKLK